MCLGFENLESMAGSSNQADGYPLDCVRIPQKLRKIGISVKWEEIDHNFSTLFNHFASKYLEYYWRLEACWVTEISSLLREKWVTESGVDSSILTDF